MTSALVTDTERVGFVLNDDRLRPAARQSTTEKMQIPCEESMQMDTSFKPRDVGSTELWWTEDDRSVSAK